MLRLTAIIFKSMSEVVLLIEIPNIFLPGSHAFLARLLIIETDEEPAAEDLVDIVALGRVSLQAHLDKFLEVGGPVALDLGHVLVDD